MCWSLRSLGGALITTPRHSFAARVKFAERREYCDWVVESLFARQRLYAAWVRRGLAAAFDGVECGFLRGEELMRLVVGVGEVNIEELRSITKYDGFEAQENVIQWFWEVLEEMSPTQRTSFLQFATARSRLPVFSHQSPLTVGGDGNADL